MSCIRIVRHACATKWEDEECTENFYGELCPETYTLKTEQGRKVYREMHVEEGWNKLGSWLVVGFGISEVGIMGSRNTLTAACMLNASLSDPQENK